MIAPYPINSLQETGRCYRLSFLYKKEFLKDIVVQEMTANERSETFSTTVKQNGFIDAISVWKKMCAKVRQFLSDDVCFRKHEEETYFSRH